MKRFLKSKQAKTEPAMVHHGCSIYLDRSSYSPILLPRHRINQPKKRKKVLIGTITRPASIKDDSRCAKEGVTSEVAGMLISISTSGIGQKVRICCVRVVVFTGERALVVRTFETQK